MCKVSSWKENANEKKNACLKLIDCKKKKKKLFAKFAILTAWQIQYRMKCNVFWIDFVVFGPQSSNKEELYEKHD